MKKRVLLGLSGGIDSAMAACLLKEEGFEVIGVTYKISDENNTADENFNKLINQLEIEHYFVDRKDIFEITVKKYFINEYLEGRTPSPCIKCNETIKFPLLLSMSEELKCDYTATGHYVNKILINNRWYIKKGIDTIKDQSYFLWNLNQKILKKTIFPLGRYFKQEVKRLAVLKGFSYLENKKESMGICFLKNKDYKQYIKENTDTEIQNGMVKTENGEIVGQHDGIPFYTIGQKKDFSRQIPGNFYVNKIDAFTNTLYVAQKDNLYKRKFSVKDALFSSPGDDNTNVTVKIRGIGKEHESECKLKFITDSEFIVESKNKLWAVTPGQPVVFYHNDIVLGGGFIENVL